MQTARFDMSAKIPEGTTKGQFALMLQNFLVERFKFSYHREKKEVPAVRAGGGEEWAEVQGVRSGASARRLGSSPRENPLR